MRNLYARSVLWLIRPALELRDKKASEASDTYVEKLYAAMQRRVAKYPASPIGGVLIRAAGYPVEPSPCPPDDAGPE